MTYFCCFFIATACHRTIILWLRHLYKWSEFIRIPTCYILFVYIWCVVCVSRTVVPTAHTRKILCSVQHNTDSAYDLSTLQNLNMATTMEIDDDECDLPTSSSGKGEKKRFEVKKVNENTLMDYTNLRLCLRSFHDIQI